VAITTEGKWENALPRPAGALPPIARNHRAIYLYPRDTSHRPAPKKSGVPVACPVAFPIVTVINGGIRGHSRARTVR